ncbi:hypothetical protein C8J57DRAFT_1678539 [Mycena rebaudengoi]|nr:hypothetical protein C8J57DRAFT_1678539 [Mycena rebaudengoi]
MADSEDTENNSSDIRSRISELDARILSPQEDLDVARRERENLQARLDNHLHPVLTLPVEITSEIFIHFLPKYPLRPPLTGLLSPALLGQICRKWREIAFNTPWLWRAIEIYLRQGISLDAQLNVLTTWLSRSKNCSVSISFEIDRDFTSLKLPQFTAALLSHSARWEHIRLIISQAFDDLLWIDGHFPLLCDLTFEGNHYRVTGSETAAVLFQDAPQLKSVVLGVLFYPSRVVLPWSQLTSITAEKLEPNVAADILRQATAIADFNCTIWVDEVVPGAVPPLVHLRSLILRDDNNDPGRQKLLLDALTAPALEHLTISERELGHESISIIAAFLSRSYCSLQSLHATEAMLPKTVYCTAFPSIPIVNVVERVDEGEAF